MIDLTKPVQTRSGRRVCIVRTDVRNDFFPVLAIVEESDDKECPRSYTADGKFLANTDVLHHLDLVNVPETRVIEGTANIYDNSPDQPIISGWRGDVARVVSLPYAIAKAVPIRIEITGDKVKITGGTE